MLLLAAFSLWLKRSHLPFHFPFQSTCLSSCLFLCPLYQYQPSSAPRSPPVSLSPCYLFLYPHSGSDWIGHLQHTLLRTGFVFRLSYGPKSNFQPALLLEGMKLDVGHWKNNILQSPRALQWSQGHPLMPLNLCICSLHNEKDNSIHWVVRHAPKLQQCKTCIIMLL